MARPLESGRGRSQRALKRRFWYSSWGSRLLSTEAKASRYWACRGAAAGRHNAQTKHKQSPHAHTKSKPTTELTESTHAHQVPPGAVRAMVNTALTVTLLYPRAPLPCMWHRKCGVRQCSPSFMANCTSCLRGSTRPLSRHPAARASRGIKGTIVLITISDPLWEEARNGPVADQTQ